MAWRYHALTTSDPYRAKARGSCDRCTRQYDLDQLQYQYDFRGDVLANTKFRVCPDCMDKPYEGYRPVKLPPDPVPVIDPRVEPLLAEENAGTAQATGTPYYITEDGTQPYVSEDGGAIYVPE